MIRAGTNEPEEKSILRKRSDSARNVAERAAINNAGEIARESWVIRELDASGDVARGDEQIAKHRGRSRAGNETNEHADRGNLKKDTG